MKKIVLIISTLVFAANNANAQLSVYSNGYVGIATSSASTPESTFSVRGSMTGYDASVKGTRRGITANPMVNISIGRMAYMVRVFVLLRVSKMELPVLQK